MSLIVGNPKTTFPKHSCTPQTQVRAVVAVTDRQTTQARARALARGELSSALPQRAQLRAPAARSVGRSV